MDVYEFFREYARMFKTYRKCVTITNMYITVEGVLPPNQEVSFECSTTKDEIDKIIQWSKDNPQKTRLQDFKEKHQNAPTLKNGTPRICAALLGYCDACDVTDDDYDCTLCWNKPVD